MPNINRVREPDQPPAGHEQPSPPTAPQQRSRLFKDDAELERLIARNGGGRAAPDLLQQVSETRQRRQREAEYLWLEGQPVARIADVLGVSVKTVRRDLESVKTALALERIDSLAERLDRTVATRRRIQAAAWHAHHKAPINSVTKIAALKIVNDCEDAINRIEGTQAPDAVNARTVAQVLETAVTLLLKTGGPQLVRQYYELLQEQPESQTSALLLAPASPSPHLLRRQTVDADPFAYEAGDDDSDSVPADEMDEEEE